MFGTGIFSFIGFFFWTIVNLIRRIGAGNWPVSTAIVSKSERRNPFMECYVIVIHYKYRNAEMRGEGTHKEPFFFLNYAEAYMRRYPGGSEFPVRVNPKSFSRSVPAERKITFTRVK
jgi:hypothetical protein